MGLLDMLNKGGGLFDPIVQTSERGFDLQKMIANTEPPAAPQFAPPQERGQSRSGVFGSDYSGEDIMSMLLRAAAIAQGDYGGAAQLGSNIGAKARAEAEAAAAERQRQIERQEGNQDYETRLGMAQRYRAPPQPPAMIRNLDEWEKLPPERKRALAEMQATLYPQFATGADKLPYQTNAAPLDPNEWEDYDPAGGGAINGTGGFRP